MYGKTNEKNSPIVAIATLLLLGALFSFIGFSVPVFADDIPASNVSVTFSVDSALDYNVDSSLDTVTVKVPLFIYLTVNGATNNSYISGYLSCNDNLLLNLPCTINGTAPNYLYFEPLEDYGITINRADLDTTRIYFDNYLINFNGSSNARFIGYLVYSANVGNSSIAMIRYNTNTWTPTLSSSYSLSVTPYETGFVGSVVTALNTAADVDTIINILNAIDSDTGYLPDILSTLQTYYPGFYSYLSNLVSINTNINNYVVSIFNILNDIDNTLDTITWKTDTGYSFTYYNESMSEVGNTFSTRFTNSDNVFYVGLNTYLEPTKIYKIRIPIGRINTSYNSLSVDYGIFINNNFTHINDSIIYYNVINRYTLELYIIPSRASTNYNNYLMLEYSTSAATYFNYGTTALTINYIDSSDIEYWTIYNTIINASNYSFNHSQIEDDQEYIENQLNNLVQDMTVIRPSAVADIADGYINQIDTSYNSSVFSFLSNRFVILMLCIVFSVAVLSYLLYGGR